MSAETKAVMIAILDKDYAVACSEHERESLLATVDYLNRKMHELRDTGKVIGSERIAVMTALNIAHEFLTYKQRNDDYTMRVDAGIRRMETKIAGALMAEGQAEV